MRLLKKTIIASIHESHRPIRLKSFLRQVSVNFGGTIGRYCRGIIINKPKAVRLSVDKYKMKMLFEENNIPSFKFGGTFSNIEYPVIVKSLRHRKHRPHLTKVDNQEQMERVFSTGERWERFYWERFTEYDREFRIHVSRYKSSEVFAAEKVVREGREGWVRNNSTSRFLKDFVKPDSFWSWMVYDCKRVLKVIGLDIAGFDVAFNSRTLKYYIIEVNTACGMGNNTRQAYVKELNKIALLKQFGL